MKEIIHPRKWYRMILLLPYHPCFWGRSRHVLVHGHLLSRRYLWMMNQSCMRRHVLKRCDGMAKENRDKSLRPLHPSTRVWHRMSRILGRVESTGNRRLLLAYSLAFHSMSPAPMKSSSVPEKAQRLPTIETVKRPNVPPSLLLILNLDLLPPASSSCFIFNCKTYLL